MDSITMLASGAFSLLIIGASSVYVVGMIVKGRLDRATPGTSGE